MHDIRRATLFTPERHPGVVYDESHPFDRSPANQPFLLLLDGRPIGVVRLDYGGKGTGIVRLVAIAPELQRQGHGRALGLLVEVEARHRGMHRLMLNAHPAAVGFYERLGWHAEVWDPTELTGIAADSVQMTKSIDG